MNRALTYGQPFRVDDRKIDEAVYKLYGLTEEEVAIIDKA